MEFNLTGPISIIMEYIDGTNLDILIKRNKGMEENLIRIYTKQILNAISYIHSKNIIHRYP